MPLHALPRAAPAQWQQRGPLVAASASAQAVGSGGRLPRSVPLAAAQPRAALGLDPAATSCALTLGPGGCALGLLWGVPALARHMCLCTCKSPWPAAGAQAVPLSEAPPPGAQAHEGLCQQQGGEGAVQVHSGQQHGQGGGHPHRLPGGLRDSAGGQPADASLGGSRSCAAAVPPAAACTCMPACGCAASNGG